MTALRYKSFLARLLLPAQEQFADFLEADDIWLANCEPDVVETLISEFRQYPCMNDPTEGVLEQIMRNASGEPIMLCVLIPGPTASACADAQNLDHIDARYRFRDSEGERREKECWHGKFRHTTPGTLFNW
ncbi:hypothetical protein AJ87_07205 [Rhizobium yanglingense]|nr:hypothetical protein AJ87_07205 [Rhizobium yanglingense]